MRYLLDTNIVIFFFKGRNGIKEKIQDVGIDNCFISEITLAELKYGAMFSQQPDKHLQEIDTLLNYIQIVTITNAIDFFANEKARLRKLGTLIDDFDLMIGATAIVNDFTLVTNNIKHFSRLENIALEDWS